ncbi:hypothetical protein PsorP6_008567 [Peronosclerospora sorghi]|uniref:Uncharacterized protein n=1 Tax=Peronosclerospora sorghi TaxID=230839 RepID=A0ACC0WCD4_9STRA|nr:hypothetical protein PsorP6_008567 [Peronosclerospora sorghi]
MRNELEQLRDEKTSVEKELAQLSIGYKCDQNASRRLIEKQIFIGKAQKALQGERQEEPEPPSDQKAEDKGLEMQNDFEGTMHGMPDD